MLEAGKDLAFVGERHEERLEHLARSPLGSEQVISVASLRAPADDLETLAVRDVLGIAFLVAHFLQKLRRTHPENLRESDYRFEARTHAAGLEPAQHPGTD